MKKFVLAMAAVAASVGLSQSAQAAFITGTQGLAVLTKITSTPTPNDISVDTVFSGLAFTTTAAQTGDYDVGTNPAGATFAATTLDTGVGPFLTFGSAAFGTFTGSAIIDGGYDAVTKTRSFSIIGSFAPGTNFPGAGANTALVSLSFTQVGGPGTAISASATLITPNPIPEPATLVMLGTFCGPVALGLIRRRKASKTLA